MKKIVKGTHFRLVEDIQTRVTSILKGLKMEALEGCFHVWRERVQKCVQFREEHLEGETG